MSLFIFSRTYPNCLYYNLKSIKVLKKDGDNKTIHNILIESCKYLNLNDIQLNKLSEILKNKNSYSFFPCLKKVVKLLKEENIKSLIILDQFKSDSIDKDTYDEIFREISSQAQINVKLLICSTTNDHEIRKECIKSWKHGIFSFSQLCKDNQNNYFYIDDLYDKTIKGNDFF